MYALLFAFRWPDRFRKNAPNNKETPIDPIIVAKLIFSHLEFLIFNTLFRILYLTNI